MLVEYQCFPRGLALMEEAINDYLDKPPGGNSPLKMRIVDLFAGCGGLSHGFVRTGKYEVVLGTDIDAQALQTFAQALRGLLKRCGVHSRIGCTRRSHCGRRGDATFAAGKAGA